MTIDGPISALKAFRLRNRVSLCALAKASGLCPSLLSRTENGWRPASKADLGVIIKGYLNFGVNAKELRSLITETADRVSTAELLRKAQLVVKWAGREGKQRELDHALAAYHSTAEKYHGGRQ